MNVLIFIAHLIYRLQLGDLEVKKLLKKMGLLCLTTLSAIFQLYHGDQI